MTLNEPLTITPHWGDRARDAFHAQQWPVMDKIKAVKLFASGVILAAAVLAIVC